MLLLLVQWTQKTMIEKLTYSDEVQVSPIFISHNIEVVERLNASCSFNNRDLIVIFDCGYQCTVLEVKVIEGHGTTIDVVLVNGVLHEGDQIVVSGMQASI